MQPFIQSPKSGSCMEARQKPASLWDFPHFVQLTCSDRECQSYLIRYYRDGNPDVISLIYKTGRQTF